MKIVYITPDYLPHIGGIEKYVYNLARYFIMQNNEVVVITADKACNHINEYFEENIHIIRLPVYSLSGILIPKKQRYKNIIENEIKNAAVVHLNDCKFLYSYFGFKKKKYKYKLFLSSHGFVFHTDKHLFLKKIFFRKLIGKNSYFYNKVICVSQQDLQIAQLNKLHNTTYVAPGVNIGKFKLGPYPQYVKNSFIYWGRITKNKGILECLKKLAIVPDCNFKVIGHCEDAAYMAELQDFIIKHELQNKVEFLGIKTDSEIKALLKNIEYIMIPSLYEGFGMILVEALGSGKKIIANKNKSFQAILRLCDAERYLFDFEDSHTLLSDKIAELRKIRIIPKNLAQFSLERMYDEIATIYQYS